MKNKSLLDSFDNALQGVIYTLKHERNFKIHFLVAFTVLVLILFLDFNAKEFLIITLTITFVLVAELFNTAIEAIVDMYCGGKTNKFAKIAKDSAAAGVLIASINSIIVGYILLFRKLNEVDTGSTVAKLEQGPIYTTLIAVIIVLMITIALKSITKADSLVKGGMPSAHAAVAFSIATCILFLSKNSVATLMAYFLAALVAQSRIEGKIHSLVQVLLGGLLGVFVTVIIFQVIHALNLITIA